MRHTEAFLKFHNIANNGSRVSSESLTFTTSNTIPEVGMCLFCYFLI